MVREGLLATLSLFAGVFALAVVGLYQLYTHSVSRRTYEIGVRMALGAAPGDVGALVVRQVRPRAGTGRRPAETPRYVSCMRDESSSEPLAAGLEKERQLIEWLRGVGRVAIGYSGGVDSSYLAAVAVDALGPDCVLAIVGRSASYPTAQWAVARAVAERIGLAVVEVDTDELEDPRYAANPTNRCYFCKTELWSRLGPVARGRGMSVLVDGTNADDLHDHRPGAQAAREHGVQSPLARLGFTKAEIRTRSRARDLPTWDQPSSPCLSSRIPYGTAVTRERLRVIERAEAALRTIGVDGDLRVRHHGDLARVELAPDELSRWLSSDSAERLRDAVMTAGYTRVALDLRGFRSGSLNVLGGVSPA